MSLSACMTHQSFEMNCNLDILVGLKVFLIVFLCGKEVTKLSLCNT